MEAAIKSLENIAADGDEATRVQLLRSLQTLQRSLMKPAEYLQKIVYSPLEAVIAQLGADMGIATCISETQGPLTFSSIAQKLNADPALVGRITKCMAAYGMIDEVEADTYASNRTCECLARDDYRRAIKLSDTIVPSFRCLPEFLEANGYKDPQDNSKAPFNLAMQTDLSMAEYMGLPDNAEKRHNASAFMKVFREGMPNAMDVYPFAEDIDSNTRTEDVLLVDVGGGFGQQCQAFRRRCPELKGRVVLQDLPEVLSQSGTIDGVEKIAQNYLEPQQIKGAKYYYLRWIFHNWSDDKCAIILSILADAMSLNSRILIDEVSLPEVHAHQYSTELDFAMMAAFCARERSETQWKKLLESVGLEIEKSLTYTSLVRDTVMAVRKKEPTA